MGTTHRSGFSKKSNDRARLLITTTMGMVFGYFIGVSFPSVSLSKINLPSTSSIMHSLDGSYRYHDPRPESRVSTDVLPPKISLSVRNLAKANLQS